MAVNSTIKRKTASGFEEIHPKTNTNQVEGLATLLSGITIDSIDDIADVNVPSPTDGYVLTWDNATSKWIAAAGGVSKSALQNLYIYGKASVAITKGQAVQFAGAQGDHILIKPAVPSEINANPNYMIGIAETSLAINDFGYVIVNGRLTEHNTSAWDAGNILYFASAGSTAGALTTTEPGDPNACIEMAAVSIDGVGNGELVVRTTILTRTIDEVTGLQTALNGKLSKSGDTATGSMRFQNDLNYFGLASGNNEAEIVINTGNDGNPQIGFTEHGDASWAIGVDDADNGFKIHGSASSTIPTIGNLETPHLEIDTTGNVYMQKRVYLTGNSYIEYNAVNDSIDFFFT